MLDPNIWRPINNNSTGYVGRRRNDEWKLRDEKFGIGNWRIAWLTDGKLLEYVEACLLYEEAYYAYFQQRPELLKNLTEVASDVYDDNPVNVESKEDYSKRGDVFTHIQDIAIRRCVRRLEKKFQGNELLQIRDRVGPHPLSIALSPGQVPFHKPEWLSVPDNLHEITSNQWWLPGSVEDWYQRAKRLCVRQA